MANRSIQTARSLTQLGQWLLVNYNVASSISIGEPVRLRSQPSRKTPHHRIWTANSQQLRLGQLRNFSPALAPRNVSGQQTFFMLTCVLYIFYILFMNFCVLCVCLTVSATLAAAGPAHLAITSRSSQVRPGQTLWFDLLLAAACNYYQKYIFSYPPFFV